MMINLTELRDMPVVTVEQVIRFRSTVLKEIERLNDELLQANLDIIRLEKASERHEINSIS